MHDAPVSPEIAGVSFLRANRAPIVGRPWLAPRPSGAAIAAADIARKSNPFNDGLVALGAAAPGAAVSIRKFILI